MDPDVCWIVPKMYRIILLSASVISPTIVKINFNFNFLARVFSEILGGSQIYTIGPYAPWTPPSGEFFFTQSDYFTISNCVFNFNILALVVSDTLGGSQIYASGPCAPLYAP